MKYRIVLSIDENKNSFYTCIRTPNVSLRKFFVSRFPPSNACTIIPEISKVSKDIFSKKFPKIVESLSIHRSNISIKEYRHLRVSHIFEYILARLRDIFHIFED